MKLEIVSKEYASHNNSAYPLEERSEVVGKYVVRDVDPNKKRELGGYSLFITLSSELYEDKKSLEIFESTFVMAEAKYEFEEAYEDER